MSTIFAITYQTKPFLHTDLDTFSDTFDALEPQTCAAVGHHSNYQPLYGKESGSKESSGSRACDPIEIQDDDEPEAAEIRQVDLGSDDEISTEGHYMASDKKAVAGAHGVGLRSLAPKSHSSYINAQKSDPSRHTETVTQPLFRALTKDDLLAPSAQSLLDSQAVGFKAWYNTHVPHHARKAAPSMQQKEFRQTPSIKLSTKEHAQKQARLDRDRPQFAMNVLRSNRKRTMGELSYNELISPAQIESPSEKRSRMAKRCRQRLEECDNRQQNTTGRDVQSALDLDHMQDSENGGMTGEITTLAVPPVMNEALDRRESDARRSDERDGPTVICEPSPVSTITLTDDQKGRNTTQHREGHSDEHVEVHHLQSAQTTAQDHDAQERGVGKNNAFSDGSTSRKPSYRKPRVGGTTNACGVFSSEIKPPIKRSRHGQFHCSRCDSQFTTSKGVKYHFEGWVAKYGNPGSLRWNDHPSLRAVEQSVVSTDKKERLPTVPAPVPATRRDSANIGHDIEPVGRPTTTTSTVAPLPASHIQAPDISILQSVTEEHASCLNHEPKLGHEASIAEHRATGGKGLSAEILNTYRETGNWDFVIDPNENIDGSQDVEAEVPNIAYQYSVIKREWLETEEDAIESSMGPYYTLDEANAVAKAEVNRPQIDGFEDIHSNGWSYYYRQDGDGMQLHMATVLGINIEAVVHRSKWLFARTFFPSENKNN